MANTWHDTRWLNSERTMAWEPFETLGMGRIGAAAVALPDIVRRTSAISTELPDVPHRYGSALHVVRTIHAWKRTLRAGDRLTVPGLVTGDPYQPRPHTVLGVAAATRYEEQSDLPSSITPEDNLIEVSAWLGGIAGRREWQLVFNGMAEVAKAEFNPEGVFSVALEGSSKAAALAGVGFEKLDEAGVVPIGRSRQPLIREVWVRH